MTIRSLLSLNLFLDGSGSYFLFVNGFQHFGAAFYRRFRKALTLSQLQQGFAFFKLFFVLLQRFVNVFAVFRIYYQHNV